MTDIEKVQQYYQEMDEWRRLETPAGRLEFQRTKAILQRHLRPGSEILDLGGGPGRYTVFLAGLGHRVHLADLSVAQLQVARSKIEEAGVADGVTSIDNVSATDLSTYPDSAFDAVLCMGPFYHLTRAEEHTQAAREVARVLRPAGLVFVAFIPKLAGLAGLLIRAASDAAQVPPEGYLSVLRSGVFRNATEHGWQEGYHFETQDLEDLFDTVGFSRVETVSLRGIAFDREATLDVIQDESPALFEQIMAVIAETEHDPRVIALGGHALYVGKRGG
jgi:S-adenosylmethionine-dependent methyltransferase